ncbi:hypothetical protein LB542_06100 [Mesorhizobium sp. BR1-1-9]|uniref:DUF4286 family protein n=1 Tax=Mesorhizobium sp. BR1-1-9 TaxID=2876646 RepID=UPI001CD14A8E|nr:DUF4286 family protein [Mesorhizobium sp. BR1-1-9]MBZ9870429.1 hypothetical protein [Mesorhizobium sp. BR1-1-9]
MAKKGNGLLLVLMQPPSTLEEEFTAWYDTEHVPERAALPGFKSALRYVNLSGYPRYMAIYDLDSVETLDTPEYQAVSGQNFSPWTKRVTSRVQVYRIVGKQVYPGDAVTHRSSRAVLLRMRAVGPEKEDQIVAALRATFEGRPETRGLRVFRADEARGTDYFCLVEMTPLPLQQIDLRDLGQFAANVDMVNIYAPYDLGG